MIVINFLRNSALEMCSICVYCRRNSIDEDCSVSFSVIRLLTIHLLIYRLLKKRIHHLSRLVLRILLLCGLTVFLVPIDDFPNSGVPRYVITIAILQSSKQKQI